MEIVFAKPEQVTKTMKECDQETHLHYDLDSSLLAFQLVFYSSRYLYMMYRTR